MFPFLFFSLSGCIASDHFSISEYVPPPPYSSVSSCMASCRLRDVLKRRSSVHTLLQPPTPTLQGDINNRPGVHKLLNHPAFLSISIEQVRPPPLLLDDAPNIITIDVCPASEFSIVFFIFLASVEASRLKAYDPCFAVLFLF